MGLKYSDELGRVGRTLHKIGGVLGAQVRCAQTGASRYPEGAERRLCGAGLRTGWVSVEAGPRLWIKFQFECFLLAKRLYSVK